VLGLPAGQASRFFSVTNALKMGNRELTGRGAVTSSLVDNFSSKDLSDVAKTSSLFLRIISGQCNDVQDDE